MGLSSDKNSRIRAELWGDYVGWDRRKEAEDGFLVRQLTEHGCNVVLDVALGDGIDTIALMQAGFKVRCNEANADFRAKAISNAKSLDIELEPTSHSWTELSTSYGDSSVDAIVCMGHSIGCVLQKEERLRSLSVFWKILKPQGILIADERNFQKMIGSVRMGQMYPCGNSVYTGSGKIAIMFSEVSETAICINYVHKVTGRRAWYRVYPFKKGELLAALRDSHAPEPSINVFSDYRAGYSDDANYYQYVCVKR